MRLLPYILTGFNFRVYSLALEAMTTLRSVQDVFGSKDGSEVQ